MNENEPITVDLGTVAATLLRIEALLQEVIFQQILTRKPNISDEEANDSFNKAIKNADDSLQLRIATLQDSTKKQS